MAVATASALSLNVSKLAVSLASGESTQSKSLTKFVSVGQPEVSLSFNGLQTCHAANSFTGGASLSKRISVIVKASEVEHVDTYTAPPPPPASGTKLYVGNLPFNCDSESLAEIFQDAGVVELVEVIYDRDSGKSRGFAFVTMATPEDAESAIHKLDGSELGGRTMRVNFPMPSTRDGPRAPRGDFPRSDRPPRRHTSSENKLYVGNLSWGMDDVGLEDLFSEFGKVQEARIVIDRETGRSRGFGFVTLSASNEVNDAVSALNGVEVDGRTIRVNPANDAGPGGNRG